jgi:hypothetical protein
MPETIYWEDQAAYQAFMDAGRAVFARIQGQLHGQQGVVAIEPASGAYYVGRTLGKANDAAYGRHPDTWLYFVRLDDPSAEIALPTW